MSNAFPTDFEKRVKNDPFLGEELLTALNTIPPVSVRLHPKKVNPKLDEIAQVSWCEGAIYLKERPVFTLDPLFHAGCYYPQEAGSMVLQRILGHLDLPEQPIVLDLCAAPGGKSTLIASFMENGGLLVSNEIISSRARILKENLTKWGYTNTMVTNNDPADFERLPHFFDAVLVDAPCSGEGMFRKDSASRNEWSQENVDKCAVRQKQIVEDIWESLKPGGFLIYSTCTFNAQENESTVQWIVDELDAELEQWDAPTELIPGRNGIGSYCIPGKTESEGFYIALIRKGEGAVHRTRYTRKKEFRRQKDVSVVSEFANLDGIQVINWNEQLIALPEGQEENMLHVQSQLRIVKMGTFLGELTRKGIIPNEELALNPLLLNYAERIELDRNQALKYLHGDTFPLSISNGYHIVTYQQQPMGWLKQVGNRFNNLYPKEWRIRMNIGS
jgi:16S rRNA C967 or C1407 C5-methylase (RsmB/RsmF family)/NOL1/NOP2/fmu family ribosome biogenesis protein